MDRKSTCETQNKLNSRIKTSVNSLKKTTTETRKMCYFRKPFNAISDSIVRNEDYTTRSQPAGHISATENFIKMINTRLVTILRTLVNLIIKTNKTAKSMHKCEVFLFFGAVVMLLPN